MKIAIVGLDDDFVENFSNQLASILNLTYKSFTAEFDKYLLSTVNQSVFEIDDVLQSQEKRLLSKLLNIDNVVLSVNDDTFLSNNNYLIFKDVLTICVEKKENDKILNNIQKLIKKHCKLVIKQENFEINSILNKIRGKYNG